VPYLLTGVTLRAKMYVFKLLFRFASAFPRNLLTSSSGAGSPYVARLLRRKQLRAFFAAQIPV